MLGFAALVAGDLARAARLQQDSLEHNRALGNTRGMALCVEMLAIVATRQQQLERAARLFAIADALCDAANYHLPPGVVAFHEQAVAGVRAMLGAREFGDAWAAGRKLPLDEGVAFAMGAGVPRRRSAGNTPELSRREMQVVQLVTEGLSDRQIAARLGISPRTVDNHLRHIFEKVGVSSRTALATWALRSALVA
jgi:non-specific serine/threonine protein kinase